MIFLKIHFLCSGAENKYLTPTKQARILAHLFELIICIKSDCNLSTMAQDQRAGE